tara:strand:- start:418 stop:750 length:333 start_codon:yes stop_codon:yes gene_type:complete
MTLKSRRVLLTIVAIPVFVAAGCGVALATPVAQQVFFGFDDQPLIAVVLGMGLGLVAMVLGFFWFCVFAWTGLFRTAVIIIAVTTTFDLAVVPVCRMMIERVEHPERFKN